MAEGTANEVPTAEYCAASNKCIHFFELGLLQSLEEEILALLVDGIAIVKIPGAIYINLGPVNESVEIKTRAGIDTIARSICKRTGICYSTYVLCLGT